jgi:hypothetical protein
MNTIQWDYLLLAAMLLASSYLFSRGKAVAKRISQERQR